jgi:hypothetical protein
MYFNSNWEGEFDILDMAGRRIDNRLAALPSAAARGRKDWRSGRCDGQGDARAGVHRGGGEHSRRKHSGCKECSDGTSQTP